MPSTEPTQQEDRSPLDALAHALMERETLDQPDAYRVAAVSPRARSEAVIT
jgi:hypothetical protein